MLHIKRLLPALLGPIVVLSVVITLLFFDPAKALLNLDKTSQNLNRYCTQRYDQESSVPDRSNEEAVLAFRQTAFIEAYRIEKSRFLEEIGYDAKLETQRMHTPPTSDLEPSLPAYVSRLRTFVEEFFTDSPHRIYLDVMLDRLEQHVPPPLLREPIPKIILSTNKDPENVPDLFNAWEDRLGPEGWQVHVADDKGMEKWFNKLVDKSEAWRRIWKILPKPVLKTDVLRYLAVLLNGGLYTDSDTQPRAHPYLWASDAENFLTPPLQSLANGIIASTPPVDLPPPPKLFADQHPNLDSYANNYTGGIYDDHIGLVVSIEWDAWIRGFDEDWVVPEYTRSMQVVQWTFMAKPYHPILLDVLETVVRNIERAEKNGELNGAIGALHLTGPGPFSDAVFRYLIATYGVPSKALERRVRSSRVGDVLLLPEWSFAQPGPQPNEWDWEGPDPQTRCVSHVSMGRWRGQGWG